MIKEVLKQQMACDVVEVAKDIFHKDIKISIVTMKKKQQG
jgi:hypothetical protein